MGRADQRAATVKNCKNGAVRPNAPNFSPSVTSISVTQIQGGRRNPNRSAKGAHHPCLVGCQLSVTSHQVSVVSYSCGYRPGIFRQPHLVNYRVTLVQSWCERKRHQPSVVTLQSPFSGRNKKAHRFSGGRTRLMNPSASGTEQPRSKATGMCRPQGTRDS